MGWPSGCAGGAGSRPVPCPCLRSSPTGGKVAASSVAASSTRRSTRYGSAPCEVRPAMRSSWAIPGSARARWWSAWSPPRALEGAASTRVQCYELERDIPYTAMGGWSGDCWTGPRSRARLPSGWPNSPPLAPDLKARFTGLPAGAGNPGRDRPDPACRGDPPAGRRR